MKDPSDHCYLILQDHGPDDGGWGPAAISFPSIGVRSGPVVYTGSDEGTISKLREAARSLARTTGKPTRLARYQQRWDVVKFEGG